MLFPRMLGCNLIDELDIVIAAGTPLSAGLSIIELWRPTAYASLSIIV